MAGRPIRPELTIDYFYTQFQDLFRLLRIKKDDVRFVKDWNDHVKHYQLFARKQHDEEGKVVGPEKRGRPPTVFPLLESVRIPAKYLVPATTPEELHARRELMISENKELSKPPTGHLFKHGKKTERAEAYGFRTTYYYNPFLLIAGEWVRSVVRSHFKFDFKLESGKWVEVRDKMETKLLNRLLYQHKKLLTVLMTKACNNANVGTGITISLSDDGGDDDDDDDDEEQHQKKRQKKVKRQQKKDLQSSSMQSSSSKDLLTRNAAHRFAHSGTYFDERAAKFLLYNCNASDLHIKFA